MIENPFGMPREEVADAPPRATKRPPRPFVARVIRGAALPLVAVIALAALVSLAISPSPRGSFGAFAGYQWTGHLTSIQASWRVPTVLRGSQPGAAATWIGAQHTDGPGAFIQLGTNENRQTVAFETRNYYDAFWSDSRLHFSPQSLGRVDPGDYISTSMVLEPGAWHLRFSDHTGHWTRTLSTHDETGARFTVGEWLQEDPTDRATNDVFPYPKLSTVRFERLTVNGAAPPASDLYPQWLSLPGFDLAPHRLVGDGFSVARAGTGSVGPPPRAH